MYRPPSFGPTLCMTTRARSNRRTLFFNVFFFFTKWKRSCPYAYGGYLYTRVNINIIYHNVYCCLQRSSPVVFVVVVTCLTSVAHDDDAAAAERLGTIINKSSDMHYRTCTCANDFHFNSYVRHGIIYVLCVFILRYYNIAAVSRSPRMYTCIMWFERRLRVIVLKPLIE